MPNYVIYDPNSTPVAGRVVGVLKSFPQEKEGEIQGSFLRDPSIAGISLNAAKVVGGVLQNLTQADTDLIAATELQEERSALKLAAKNIFITPNSPDHQAIKLGFQTLSEIMLSEINALRTNAGLSIRTQAQLNNAFKSGVESKIDAL